MTMKTYTGGCQCGAVRFEADLDLAAGVGRCNCTFCMKIQQAGVSVAPSAFRLLSGKEHLRDFAREGSPLHYPFCDRCGVRSFGHGHLEELGGEYVAVYVNCLDDIDIHEHPVKYWDGRHDNWHAGTRDTPWPVHRRDA